MTPWFSTKYFDTWAYKETLLKSFFHFFYSFHISLVHYTGLWAHTWWAPFSDGDAFGSWECRKALGCDGLLLRGDPLTHIAIRVWREAYFNSWDKWEFLSISCSRREPELLSFNLVLLDENENFFFSISGFETRTRIEIETILARIFKNYIYCSFID